MVSGDDYYYQSDSDDDDDVDRYVFLARQPAPASRHAAEGASSDSDSDDDVAADGGGGRGEKRHLQGVLDSPPAPKKSRLHPIASPPPPSRPSGSEATSPPREESRREDVAMAHEDDALREGQARNRTKKHGVCGKRSRGPDRDDDGDREPRPAFTAAASATTSGRFLCNQCERCFASHQALGGHVLGHRKKAKIALAAAACHAGGDGAGNCGKLMTLMAVSQEAAATGIGHGEKVAFDAIEGDHEEEYSGGHSKAKKASVAARNHFAADGSGSDDVTAAKDENVNGDDDLISNTNGNACKALYKCKVCGTECPTGQALGGHMRKHRKRPSPGGDGEAAADGDGQTLAQLFGTEMCLKRALMISGEQAADMVHTS
ncbi:hypothetical protein ACP4OV_007796 [Aristida adscensionis]